MAPGPPDSVSRVPPIEFVDLPTRGRVFRAQRRVRLGDVTPAGRARFDALARYLQDIARDDSADSALENPMGWVVRRTAIRVRRWPTFQELLASATWCSGIGPRWAERRTEIVGEHGALIDTATLWVHVDAATGRPARLVKGFADRYGEAAGGRGADAQLLLASEAPGDVVPLPWPLRYSDFDILGHMNNAAYWAALEEILVARSVADLTMTAVMEHRQAIAPGQLATVFVAPADTDGAWGWWLVAGGATAAAGLFIPSTG